MLRRKLVVAAAIAAPLVLATMAILVWNAASAPPKPAIQTEKSLDIRFSLRDQAGRTLTQDAFRGRITAWFFGFTYCPDVCPTTLLSLTQLLRNIGDDADEINVVFVSVDPARDTPDVLKSYLSAFDPRIVGLTGDQQEIDRLAKSLFIYHAKIPQDESGYTMDHTSTVLVTDPKFRLLGTLDTHEPEEVQKQKMRRLIGAGRVATK